MNKRDIERAIKAKLEVQKILIAREEQPENKPLPAAVKKQIAKMVVLDKECEAANKASNVASKRTEKIVDDLRKAGFAHDGYRRDRGTFYKVDEHKPWQDAKYARQRELDNIMLIDLPLAMATVTLQGEDTLPAILAELIARIEGI